MKGSIASLQPEPEDAAPSGSQTHLQNEKEETASTTSKRHSKNKRDRERYKRRRISKQQGCIPVLAENRLEIEQNSGAIQRVDSGSNYPTDTSPTVPLSIPTTITTRSADEQQDIWDRVIGCTEQDKEQMRQMTNTIKQLQRQQQQQELIEEKKPPLGAQEKLAKRVTLNESKLQKSTNGLVRLHALTVTEPIDPPPTTAPLRLVTDGILRIPNNWLHQSGQDLNVLAENEISPRLMA